jgi:beta-galactosidase
VPALTRRRHGAGAAWYVATRLSAGGTAKVLRELCTAAGVQIHDHPGVEVVRRHGTGTTYVFVLNHTAADAEVPAQGHDLVTGADVDGKIRVPAGGVAVVRERGE